MKREWLFASMGMLSIWGLTGCGGTGERDTDIVPPCSVLKAASFSVEYPARSRSIGPSSGLSGKFVVTTGGSPSTVTVDFARNASLSAHTESYPISSIPTTATSAALTFYAGANQSGAVVATATVPLTVSCSKLTVGSFSLATSVSKVTVSPATLTVGSSAQQLNFVAADSAGAAVAVSPGSALFASTGSAATLTQAGVVTPVSSGTISVTATVDGVTSAPATVTIQAKTTTGAAYSIIDLGPYAVTPAYAFLSPVQVGRLLNNGTKCVVYDPSAQQFDIIDYKNPSAKTVLGGSTDQTQIFAIDDKGDVIGQNIGNGAVYWKGTNYSTPSFFSGLNVHSANAINGAGSIVGTALSDAFYWTNFTAAAQILPELANPAIIFTPRDINASGLIVGTATSPDEKTQVAIYYSSPTSAPTPFRSRAVKPSFRPQVATTRDLSWASPLPRMGLWLSFGTQKRLPKHCLVLSLLIALTIKE